MPQRNLARSVARAAASGGGKAYRSRPAVGWYLTMILIVLGGVSLIVYSRQEALHPTSSSKAAPTATDRWYSAIAFSACGVTEKPLPANPNLASTGIRTFGDGLIYTQPGVVGSSKASAFEGSNANLATFVSNYPGLKLSPTSLTIPGVGSFKNGDLCSKLPKGATAAQRTAATGSVEIETWSSPTAKGEVFTGIDPKTIRLTNGEMISVGFVVAGKKLPVPPSKAALVAILGGRRDLHHDVPVVDHVDDVTERVAGE